MSIQISSWISVRYKGWLALFEQVVIIVRYVSRVVVRYEAGDVGEHIPDTRAPPISLDSTLDLEG
jgi:hypothetical protein